MNIEQIIEENKKLKNDIEQKDKEIQKLKSDINNNINEINNLKNEKQKLFEENQNLKNLNNELSNKLKLLQLNNINNNQNIADKNNIMPKVDELKIKDNNVNELKDLIPVIFQTVDKEITYAFICKKTDKFNKIEELFYETFPDLEENENYENQFKIKGKRVIKTKTMEKNNINYSDIIVLNRIKVE